MTRKLVSMQIWAAKRIEGARDRGQGTIEYVGMVIAAVVVVLAVATAIKAAGIDTTVGDKIKSVLNQG
ncbi:hypothetical protein LWF15_02160 [Kineosporia rhizophila]|uniref:hypothetical protein n=1 Tax=Kineosporia TaxID=49184 RepID=UPI000AB6595D|nr:MULTISPECIES: hypothetical protein [Kineosporia]MCE0534303.1 hypothetical protein [Kineosporia rhizophila]GLY13851.1 hypothetical protein Kisp01_08670 [Kineosporia sp. NBRC 101677]